MSKLAQTILQMIKTTDEEKLRQVKAEIQGWEQDLKSAITDFEQEIADINDAYLSAIEEILGEELPNLNCYETEFIWAIIEEFI